MNSKIKVIFQERECVLASPITYTESEGFLICNSQSHKIHTLATKVRNTFKNIFLPYGFPNSVSPDYVEYQKWDTLQAFCSTLTGTFTTQAVLQSVGVGKEEAKPLSAAITWVLKDGSGMIGRIVFAWWKGSVLDAECKQWRLFADVLNDAAIIMEFLLPNFFSIATYVLCITSTMKALVGVAGSATRASITQHQAIKGNMADVSAKDGSQETCVNLIASIIGVFFLSYMSYDGIYTWGVICFLTALHIVANYKAVKSLTFNHLNTTRFLLVLKTYLRYDSVGQPFSVNQQEPLFMGHQSTASSLCGFDIQMGVSLQVALSHVPSGTFLELQDLYKERNYIIVPDIKHRVLYVAIRENDNASDGILAYFNAILLGIGLCYYNNVDLNFNMKRHLKHVTPLQRLHNVMKAFPKNEGKPIMLPTKISSTFHEFVISESASFFTALNINAWDLNKHSLPIGEWRYASEYISENEKQKAV